MYLTKGAGKDLKLILVIIPLCRLDFTQEQEGKQKVEESRKNIQATVTL